MDGDIVYRFAYVWVACWEVASFVHKLKGLLRMGGRKQDRTHRMQEEPKPKF